MHPTIAKRDTGTGVLAANGLNLGISTELIQDGVLRIDFRDGAIQISAGEMFVVPKGVDHKPYAEHEVKLLLIEPRGPTPGIRVAIARPRTTCGCEETFSDHPCRGART